MPRLVLLASLPLLAFAACTEPATEEQGAGCRTDTECGDGSFCDPRGLCVPAGGGAGGGGAGGAPGCVTSVDCLERPFGSVPYFWWDGAPGLDAVCTSRPVRCPTGAPCDAPTSCEEIGGAEGRPGGAACVADGDCWSGRCLPWQGGGLCLRSCGDDGDCPSVTVADRTIGQQCVDDVVENVRYRRCVPRGDDPAATICRTDADCPSDRACRFDGEVYFGPKAVPLCLPRVEAGLPAGAFCPGAPDAPRPTDCHAGICMEACVAANATVETRMFCDVDTFRCSAACVTDEDCPHRLVCQTGEWQNRIGSWDDLNDGGPRFGREIRYCVLPPGGCHDELECCPELLPDGTCGGGWSALRMRCSVHLRPPATAPQLVTLCDPPDGRATPGACCADHDACDSGLCVPAREGSACAGGGVCSVPCEPALDPASGASARDRCAEGARGEPYHAASRCLPLRTTFTSADGLTLEAELNACQ